jgi:phospholipid transport system transporter-binding protein
MSAAQLEARGAGAYALSGELSFATVPEVWVRGRRLLAGEQSVTLDLQGVVRTDSAGLALLIEWTRETRRQGRAIRFVNVPAQMLAIAGVSGLEAVLPLERAPG